MLARLIASLTILLLALVSVLPWGQDGGLSFFMPASSFMAIHYWDARHPGLVHPLFIVVVGLGIDVLTSGPLGFWPLVFLAGYAASRSLARLARPSDAFTQWLSFVASALIATVFAWLAASAYFVQPVDWKPMLVSVLAQAFAYPVLAWLLAQAARLIEGPRMLTLERRG